MTREIIEDKKLSLLIISGVWDNYGGRTSGYTNKLFDSISSRHGINAVHMNGGYYGQLESVLEENIKNVDAVLWFPDIPNELPKLAGKIKETNSKAILVTSKNNRSGKYSRLMLISRALKDKANLLVEITNHNNQIAATIIDPLGNNFIEEEVDIDSVAQALCSRIIEISQFTRVPSKQIGDNLDPIKTSPEQCEFFDLTREYANKFHSLIHAANQDRLLGNVSFRCEHGFPSYKDKELIYVSRRNIDKRDINSLGFVAVDLHSQQCVNYYGNIKPSVDTPIQVMLYNYYANVKYMLHAHVYISDAPATESIVPCGAIEEFYEIINLVPDASATNFAINLKGHGSLVLAKDIEFLRNIPYIARFDTDN